MKRIFFFLCFLQLSLYAQIQWVQEVKDSNGDLLLETGFSAEFFILDSTSQTVFEEFVLVQSSSTGVLSHLIGSSNSSISEINWKDNNYVLQVNLNQINGDNEISYEQPILHAPFVKSAIKSHPPGRIGLNGTNGVIIDSVVNNGRTLWFRFSNSDTILIEGIAGMNGVDGEDQKYVVGEQALGGTIVYVDPSGEHGLVAANQDIGRVVWDSDGNFAGVGSTKSFTGGGIENMYNFLFFNRTGTNATLLCMQYEGGGYGDWYLPSLQELQIMYQARLFFPNGFSSGLFNEYWSSTETTQVISAWGVNFSTGFASRIHKGTQRQVRPVRKF
jgi:hypothetical protein